MKNSREMREKKDLKNLKPKVNTVGKKHTNDGRI
jgi:hypothetical protein